MIHAVTYKRLLLYINSNLHKSIIRVLLGLPTRLHHRHFRHPEYISWYVTVSRNIRAERQSQNWCLKEPQ